MEQRSRRRTLYRTLAIFALLVVSVAVVSPAAAQDNSAGATVYKEKCTTCHGPDGAGTAVGKSLQVADLRSAAVQKKSDAELIQSVSDGKGNMPAFKGNITDDEIHAAIAFVRTFAGKGDPKKK
jgi:cytochrome c6